MATASRRNATLTRCLQLNALAMAFSLAHVIADYAILTAQAGGDALALPWYLALAGAAYGWWGWSMAQATAGGRAGPVSLLVLSGLWAGVLNGGSLVFTSPTIVLADVIHFGSLLLGIAAAYATWRLLLSAMAPAVRA